MRDRVAVYNHWPCIAFLDGLACFGVKIAHLTCAEMRPVPDTAITHHRPTDPRANRDTEDIAIVPGRAQHDLGERHRPHIVLDEDG